MRTLFIQNNGIQESIGIANLAGILKANGHPLRMTAAKIATLKPIFASDWNAVFAI